MKKDELNAKRVRRFLPKLKALSNLQKIQGGNALPGYITMPCPQTQILCPKTAGCL